MVFMGYIFFPFYSSVASFFFSSLRFSEWKQSWPGPILERTCMRFFRKMVKKGKIFENLGENVQKLKIIWKWQVIRTCSCIENKNNLKLCSVYKVFVDRLNWETLRGFIFVTSCSSRDFWAKVWAKPATLNSSL